mmetsp:Transcript_73127/g.200800  ORF Transcript_73127/g.200800 Transcript_73127/m.200800 type:complete len:561 (-) Transcript_73127:65-1747(-)
MRPAPTHAAHTENRLQPGQLSSDGRRTTQRTAPRSLTAACSSGTVASWPPTAAPSTVAKVSPIWTRPRLGLSFVTRVTIVAALPSAALVVSSWMPKPLSEERSSTAHSSDAPFSGAAKQKPQTSSTDWSKMTESDGTADATTSSLAIASLANTPRPRPSPASRRSARPPGSMPFIQRPSLVRDALGPGAGVGVGAGTGPGAAASSAGAAASSVVVAAALASAFLALAFSRFLRFASRFLASCSLSAAPPSPMLGTGPFSADSAAICVLLPAFFRVRRYSSPLGQTRDARPLGGPHWRDPREGQMTLDGPQTNAPDCEKENALHSYSHEPAGTQDTTQKDNKCDRRRPAPNARTPEHPTRTRSISKSAGCAPPEKARGALLLLERRRHPVEALVETVARGRARRLDVPVALAQRVEAELVGDLRSVHRVRQVLLVGEDQQDGLPQLVLVQHAVQLVARLAHAVAIVGINDEDDTLGVLVVVAPERADLVLAADVPHGERDVLVLDGLDVEADGRDGGHNLAKLELVEDGGLASSVEADHEDANILLAEELAKELGEGETHD